MRQLVYSMFITNNHDSFHLWSKENLVKHQDVSKYYDQGCSMLIFCSSKWTKKTHLLDHVGVFVVRFPFVSR